MNTDDVRAAASALTTLHHRFAPLFGRKEAQAQSLVYLNGLLLSHEGKSAEPMALVFGEADDDGIGQNQVLGLQRFLSQSPWESGVCKPRFKRSLPNGWCRVRRPGRSARLGFSPTMALHVQTSHAYQHSQELADSVCESLVEKWGGGCSE
jgi:hypothetical protein